MLQDLLASVRLARPTRHVAVAVGVNENAPQQLAVAWNSRWHGYAFPTRRFLPQVSQSRREERAQAVHVARAAFLNDFGPHHGTSVSGHWMDQIEVLATSARDGRRVRYLYEVVLVRPERPLPVGGFAERWGTLSREEILDSTSHEPGPQARLVTWTTHRVLQRLVESQHAAVALVGRENQGRREYLMTLNRELRYFFPARRMREDDDSARIVAMEFTVGANLVGVQVGPSRVFDLVQHNALLGERNYRFHVHPVTLDDAQLQVVFETLGGTGQVAWIPEDDFTPNRVSDTAQQLLQRLH